MSSWSRRTPWCDIAAARASWAHRPALVQLATPAPGGSIRSAAPRAIPAQLADAAGCSATYSVVARTPPAGSSQVESTGPPANRWWRDLFSRGRPALIPRWTLNTRGLTRWVAVSVCGRWLTVARRRLGRSLPLSYRHRPAVAGPRLHRGRAAHLRRTVQPGRPDIGQRGLGVVDSLWRKQPVRLPARRSRALRLELGRRTPRGPRGAATGATAGAGAASTCTLNRNPTDSSRSPSSMPWNMS